MSKNYDNWERLVEAVLLKEHLRHLALCHSARSSSAITDGSSRLSFSFSSYSSFNGSIHAQDEHILQSLAIYNQEVMSRKMESRPLSFFHDIETGKICYIIGGRDLTFSFGDSTHKSRTTFVSVLKRFSGVAIVSDSPIGIEGWVQMNMLCAKVTYAAYLVYTLVECYEGTGSTYGNLGKIVRRADGWMEIKIKEFYVDHGDDREYKVQWVLKGIQVKSKLTVKCIELRPT